MAVCNVTPDSFSDGGLAFEPAAARARIDRVLDEGADVVDLGGESTRPGAAPISDDEQLRRLYPALAHALQRGACVSVDTQSPKVADACLAAGAHAINDVSCLRDDALARVVASHDAAYVLMHARGSQEKMAGFSRYPDDGYGDPVRDVLAEWSAAAERAEREGVREDALVFDPGFGFAKNARQSTELLARLSEIVAALRCPVLVGASRKSFLTQAARGGADRLADPVLRLGASIAAAVFAVRAGARAVRVHDVAATRQALELERSLASWNGAGAGRAEPITVAS